MDRILLIDGMNSVWRANVAFKPEEKQEPSYVLVYNFFRQLRATIEEFCPTKVFFCLEGSHNFRYKIFPDYKANRIIKTGSIVDAKSDTKQKDREDIIRQANIITTLISKLPITVVSADKFEADDVVATLAEDLKDEDVVVLSNDSDFIQLLQKGYKNFRIYNPMKKMDMIAPEFHYVSFKSLKGDVSDAIPGLVGPKTAEKLASDIKKFAEFMESSENRANYSLNKELIEFRIIPTDELQFVEYNTDYDGLKEEFSKMDFKTILEPKYWERFIATFSGLR